MIELLTENYSSKQLSCRRSEDPLQLFRRKGLLVNLYGLLHTIKTIYGYFETILC